MIGVGTTIFLINPTTFGGSSFTNEKSLLFDGVDEYVNAAAPAVLNSATNISISCWIKINTNRSQRLLGGYKDASNQFGFSLLAGGQPLFVFDGSTYAQGPVFVTGTWYHLVLVYDGGGATNSDKVKMYTTGIDRTLSFTGTMPSSLSSTFSSGNWRIGDRDLAASPFDGYIDEVAIFDYALDSTQVTSLYNSGQPTDLDNTSGVTAPVHWWRMGDGDTYPTITDVGTTGGNDGTMTNMESGDIVTDTP